MKKNNLSLERHKAQCSICQSPNLKDIERAYLGWLSLDKIVELFTDVKRDAVHRHAHATGLFEARGRNIQAALANIIERASEAPMTAAAAVSAMATYAKINSRGEFVDRSEVVNLNELYGKMSRGELTAYAEKGTLPAWWPTTVSSPAVIEEDDGDQD